MTDQLICNGVNIDLSEGIPTPLNFSIADSRDPKKRARNFSKEIKIPATANNSRFFQSAFSLTVTDGTINFDATQKTSATLLKNGIPVFINGVLRLKEVTIVDGFMEFTVALFSEVVDYFLLLQSINVSDLDWSSYDHTLSRTNIKNSWVATAGSGYYYPAIERGNGRPGTLIWRTKDFIPYVYLKEVIEKMFDHIGVPISSTWLNTTRVKNILFGYGGGDYIDASITLEDIAAREVDLTTGQVTYSKSINPFWGQHFNFSTFQFEGDLETTITMGWGINKFNDTNLTITEASDTLNQYENGKITVAKSGNYTITFGGTVEFSYSTGTLTYEYSQGQRLAMLKNGVPFYFTNTISSTTSNPFSYSAVKEFTVYLQSGDVIEYGFVLGQVNVSRANDTIYDTVTVSVSEGTDLTVNMTCIDSAVTDGATVTLSKFIPNMKCSEFLLNAIRQFNLYLSDPDIDGTITIEPLDDFYQGTDVFDDISQEIDHSKEFKLTPSANEYAKDLKYKFKKNPDYDNMVYVEKWEEEYGDYEFQQQSYFAKGEQKIEVSWSTIVPYEIADGFLVPRFITIDNSGNVKDSKGAPRLVMRNGLKTGSWTFTNTDTPSSFENLTTYPCIHHFDDWENPTFDLNFKLVNEVFYTATVVTTLNSYSDYYSTFINEMTNSAGKIVNCSVKWSELDVKGRDFSKLIMINGALFRLNKIIDFDSNARETTPIELIKVLEANKKATSSPPGFGFPGIKDGGVISPTGTGEDTGVIIGGANAPNQNSSIFRG